MRKRRASLQQGPGKLALLTWGAMIDQHATAAPARIPRVLVVEDDVLLADGLARGLAQAGFAVTLCARGELALAALRRGAMMDPSMRILIVEDDATLGSGLGRILQSEGYAVDLMARGEQAVQAAQRERFDLVILDVGLPDASGFEIFKRIRASSEVPVVFLTARSDEIDRVVGLELGADDYVAKPFSPRELVARVRGVLRRLRGGAQRMPVLVLTARDTVDDRVHGLDLGADDYLAKPFAMPELAARVRALIRRSQAQSGPRIVHGPLALDTVARRAFLDEAPLDLAAREWAVLEVLLARVERVVSKESIIQAVASWGDELSANAIEVYVSRLRAKLEPAGIRIRTVRGFGYMLEEFRETH